MRRRALTVGCLVSVVLALAAASSAGASLNRAQSPTATPSLELEKLILDNQEGWSDAPAGEGLRGPIGPADIGEFVPDRDAQAVLDQFPNTRGYVRSWKRDDEGLEIIVFDLSDQSSAKFAGVFSVTTRTAGRSYTIAGVPGGFGFSVDDEEFTGEISIFELGRYVFVIIAGPLEARPRQPTGRQQLSFEVISIAQRQYAHARSLVSPQRPRAPRSRDGIAGLIDDVKASPRTALAGAAGGGLAGILVASLAAIRGRRLRREQPVASPLATKPCRYGHPMPVDANYCPACGWPPEGNPSN